MSQNPKGLIHYNVLNYTPERPINHTVEEMFLLVHLFCSPLTFSSVPSEIFFDIENKLCSHFQHPGNVCVHM